MSGAAIPELLSQAPSLPACRKTVSNLLSTLVPCGISDLTAPVRRVHLHLLQTPDAGCLHFPTGNCLFTFSNSSLYSRATALSHHQPPIAWSRF